MRKARFTTRHKIWLVLAVLLLAGAGWIGYRTYRILTYQIVIPPSPPLPVPNAYNLYLAAETGLEKQKDALLNAELCLQNGAYTPGRCRRATPPTLAEIRKLSKSTAPIITSIHRGFTLECRQPPDIPAVSVMSNFNRLQRVLCIDGELRAIDGDLAGAVSRFLDTMRLGSDLTHGSSASTFYDGYYVAESGRLELWSLLPRIPPMTARNGAQRLEEITKRREVVADIIAAEKNDQEREWLLACRQGRWREKKINHSYPITVHNDADSNVVTRKIYDLQVAMLSPKFMLWHYDLYMNAWIKRARQPYCGGSEFPPVPDDPLIKNRLGYMPRSIFFDFTYAEAQDALLMVALALKAYRADHGTYPQDLRALAPAYLQQVPLDPFGGQPLRYQRSANGYRLYSVGPDNVDDGGKPSADGQLSSSYPNYNLQQTSKGDVVAGVNIQ
ncbi:MAG: hypothetical protein ACYDCO_11300 [Armatimonadota bacterium]